MCLDYVIDFWIVTQFTSPIFQLLYGWNGSWGLRGTGRHIVGGKVGSRIYKVGSQIYFDNGVWEYPDGMKLRLAMGGRENEP